MYRPRFEPMAAPVYTIGASAPTEPPKPIVSALVTSACRSKIAVISNEESALPMSGNVTVGIFYPYSEFDSSYNGWTPNILAGGQSDAYPPVEENPPTPDLSHAGKCVLYGAWNIEVSDGVFPSVSMQQLNSLVKIPAGISWNVEATNPNILISDMRYFGVGTNTDYFLPKYKNDVGIRNNSYQFGAVNYYSPTEKKTLCDIYIPVFPGEYEGLTLFFGSQEVPLGDKTIVAGKVYDLSEILE